MNLRLFAVWDSKANYFGTPFSDQSEASAIRNFSSAVNDGSNPNNLWHKHPEDFSLFYLGDFDSQSGEIMPVLPKNLIIASSLRETNNEKQVSNELRVLQDSKGLKPA